MPGDEDELAEFDMDEAEFDARMAAAEPVELVAGPVLATITTHTAHGTFTVRMHPLVSVSIGEVDPDQGPESTAGATGRLPVHRVRTVPA